MTKKKEMKEGPSPHAGEVGPPGPGGGRRVGTGAAAPSGPPGHLPRQAGEDTVLQALRAEYPAVANLIPEAELTGLLDGVQAGLDRLYAIDVAGFEFDFLVPDTRAR